VGIAVRKAKKFGAVSWVRRNLLDRYTSREDIGSGEGADRVDAGRDAERMLASLPEGWRTVVVLNLVEGWTAEEIAASLGISPNTVFTRIFRARQQLRAQWPAAHE
jgi:RNA polymerase sigma factor (sigma-70 family)